MHRDTTKLIQRLRQDIEKPKVDELVALVEAQIHRDATEFTVDSIFGNGFSYIPEDYQDLRRKYFDIALYYFKNRHMERRANDPKATIPRRLGSIAMFLLNPTHIPKEFGDSPIYQEVASEIVDFYQEVIERPIEEEEKDRILDGVGKELFGIYLLLEGPRDRKSTRFNS